MSFFLGFICGLLALGIAALILAIRFATTFWTR